MIRAHQPGSLPIDIPEVIPNPAVVPKQEPAPKEPAPKEPVKVPEKVLRPGLRPGAFLTFSERRALRGTGHPNDGSWHRRDLAVALTDVCSSELN